MPRFNHLSLFITFFLLVYFSIPSQADVAGVEFSADVVQSQPGGANSEGKVYVGKNFIRSEFTRKGKRFIRLIDNKKRVAYILFPDQKEFFEERGYSEIVPSGANRSPCKGRAGDVCKKLGNESVYGRAVEKWSISTTLGGQVVTGTLWLDSERGIPLREQWSNGPSMERRMVGMATVQGGRLVEKWQTSSRGPKGQVQQITEWYDPKLKLAIKEEYSGGWVRELRNIKEGSQPSFLFTVPADYRKLSETRRK